MAATAKPLQNQYHPLRFPSATFARPHSAITQPRVSRASSSPMRATRRKPKQLRSTIVEIHAADYSAETQGYAVDQRDDADAGEGGTGACPEFGHPEDTEKDGRQPEAQGRLFEPGLEMPVGHDPGASQKLARDLGVDAFVPVGERLMAKQRQQHCACSQRGQQKRDACLGSTSRVLIPAEGWSSRRRFAGRMRECAHTLALN